MFKSCRTVFKRLIGLARFEIPFAKVQPIKSCVPETPVPRFQGSAGSRGTGDSVSRDENEKGQK